jgi:hypothetical protein
MPQAHLSLLSVCLANLLSLINILGILQLLTIITNNFYEAHVKLMDSIVKRALENTVRRKSSVLSVEDFAFGFGVQLSFV